MSNEIPTPPQYPLGEPSVLDYVKSLFRARNGEHIQMPAEAEIRVGESIPEDASLLVEASGAQSLNDVSVEPTFVDTPIA